MITRRGKKLSKEEDSLNKKDEWLGYIFPFFQLNKISSSSLSRWTQEVEASDTKSRLSYGKFRRFKK